jgi:DNA/RNA endonuclease YhcR with UshA esterase domain
MKTLCRPSLLLVLLATWLAASLEAQTATVIPDTEAAQHVGQQATVEGTVVAVFTSKNGNTLLNFGGRYPNQTFTGWVPAGTPLASDPALRSLQGTSVKITGTVTLYKGKPEIRITSKEQIQQDED